MANCFSIDQHRICYYLLRLCDYIMWRSFWIQWWHFFSLQV